MSQPPLTPARANRHEALHIRTIALLKQLEAVAKTRPNEAVSPPVRRLAEDLMFEARTFRPRGDRRGLPAAAPDNAGLAAQLGQTVAVLDAFIELHVSWDPSQKCRVWTLSNGARAPLRGETPDAPRAEPDQPETDMERIRSKVEKHIAHRERAIFEAGRRASSSGQSADDALRDTHPPRLVLRTFAPHIAHQPDDGAAEF